MNATDEKMNGGDLAAVNLLEPTETKGKHHVTLSKKVKYNGEEYKELDFDFTKLTGRDAMRIEQELQSQGIAVLMESVSGPYLIRLAVRACKQPIGTDFFENLPLLDYKKIKKLARNFILASE